MNMTVVWLILLVIMIIAELFSMALTTIWFAGGCLIAAAAAAFQAPLWLQIALFFVVSVALLWFTRPIAVKYFNKDRIRTNVESMIGMQAIVISEIDNLEGTGMVKINGQEWSARAFYEEMKLPVGMVVIVRQVSGVKLIVEPR